MPGGDGNGPMGRGAMTGWGRGQCSETEGPQFARGGSGGSGRGFGGGVGRGGRDRRHRFWATGTPGRMRGAASPQTSAGAELTVDTQLEILEQRAAALEVELKEIKARLGELEIDESSKVAQPRPGGTK